MRQRKYSYREEKGEKRKWEGEKGRKVDETKEDKERK
jgi:hypothetical protein